MIYKHFHTPFYPIRPKFTCIHRAPVDTRPGLSRLLPLLLHCVIASVFLVNDIAADPAVSAIVKAWTRVHGVSTVSLGYHHRLPSFLPLFANSLRISDSSLFFFIFFFYFCFLLDLDQGGISGRDRNVVRSFIIYHLRREIFKREPVLAKFSFFSVKILFFILDYMYALHMYAFL